MLKDFTKANYLTLIAIFLSLIVMFFGNNFIQQWQKAKLFYSSLDVELQYPSKSLKTLTPKSPDSTFKFYKEVRIINVKTTSASDLKIFVNTNGEIKASKAYSIEDAIETRIDSGVMKIKLDRLVKGADIICQFWFYRKPGSLSVKYLDNEGVKEIVDISDRDELNYFAIIGGMVTFFIIVWMLYSYYYAPLLASKQALEEKNIELQLKYDNVSSLLEESKVNPADVAEENTLETLIKILDAHKNKSS